MLEQDQRRNAANSGGVETWEFCEDTGATGKKIMPVAKRMKPVTKGRWYSFALYLQEDWFRKALSQLNISFSFSSLSFRGCLHCIKACGEVLLLEMEVGRGESFRKEAASWGPRTHRVSGRLTQILLKQLQNYLPPSQSPQQVAQTSVIHRSKMTASFQCGVHFRAGFRVDISLPSCYHRIVDNCVRRNGKYRPLLCIGVLLNATHCNCG